jgi:hypothetical protein
MLSFFLVTRRSLYGFIIGIIAALIGIYIFRNDSIYLILNQVFYLICNSYGIIKYKKPQP